MKRFFVHAILVAAVAFALYPVLWVVSLALEASDVPRASVLPWPEEISLTHFEHYLQWKTLLPLGNSIVVSFATAFCAVCLAAPAAYALSRFDFLGKKQATETMLATQMFPGVASSVPLYLILQSLGLLDTRSGLVLVYATTAVPFAIFQLRGAFDAIPRDLEEAAMVDGASRFGAFTRVVLPAARPAIAVTMLFAFMTAWNEFILAATFLSSEELFTMPYVLHRHVGRESANWGAFAAGAVIVSAPVMALFYYVQRHLVSGVTAGSVKG